MGSWRSRRGFVAALPLALGGSALAAACNSVHPLEPPVPTAKSAASAASSNAGYDVANVGGASGATAASATAASGEVDVYPYFPGRRNTGRRGSAKLEYATLPAAGSLTLLDLKDGPGYISHLWAAINCPDPLAREH